MLENKNTLMCNPIVWLFKFLILTSGIIYLYYIVFGEKGWALVPMAIKGYFVVFMVFYVPSRFITYTCRWLAVCKRLRQVKKQIEQDVYNIKPTTQSELRQHDEHVKRLMKDRKSVFAIIFSSAIIYCSFFLFLIWLLLCMVVRDKYNLPHNKIVDTIFVMSFWYIPSICLCYIYDKSIYLATIYEIVHEFKNRYRIIIKGRLNTHNKRK